MAELLIGVRDQGPDPLARDNDTVSAWSQHRIECCHAHMLCFPRDGKGLKRREGQLAELYQQEICQYKFEQVSKTEVKRTNLMTLEERIYNNKPHPLDGQYMNVELHLATLRRGGEAQDYMGQRRTDGMEGESL